MHFAQVQIGPRIEGSVQVGLHIPPACLCMGLYGQSTSRCLETKSPVCFLKVQDMRLCKATSRLLFDTSFRPCHRLYARACWHQGRKPVVLLANVPTPEALKRSQKACLGQHGYGEQAVGVTMERCQGDLRSSAYLGKKQCDAHFLSPD